MSTSANALSERLIQVHTHAEHTLGTAAFKLRVIRVDSYLAHEDY